MKFLTIYKDFNEDQKWENSFDVFYTTASQEEGYGALEMKLTITPRGIPSKNNKPEITYDLESHTFFKNCYDKDEGFHECIESKKDKFIKKYMSTDLWGKIFIVVCPTHWDALPLGHKETNLTDHILSDIIKIHRNF